MKNEYIPTETRIRVEETSLGTKYYAQWKRASLIWELWENFDRWFYDSCFANEDISMLSLELAQNVIDEFLNDEKKRWEKAYAEKTKKISYIKYP